MNLLIQTIVALLLLVVPILAFFLARSRRMLLALGLPVVVVAVGAEVLGWLDRNAVSEQSRFFGALVFGSIIAIMTVAALLGCLAGYFARDRGPRRRREDEE